MPSSVSMSFVVFAAAVVSPLLLALVFDLHFGFSGSTPVFGFTDTTTFDKFGSSPNTTRFLCADWSSAAVAAALFFIARVMRTHCSCSAISLSWDLGLRERERAVGISRFGEEY
jgi:hypothetical protein